MRTSRIEVTTLPHVPSVPVRERCHEVLLDYRAWNSGSEELGLSDLLLSAHAGFWYADFPAVMAYLGHAGEQRSH